MPVPKRKRSRQRKMKRRANWGMQVEFPSLDKALSPLGVTSCVSHKTCKEVGVYKMRKIVETKQERMQRREQERKARTARKEQRTQQGSGGSSESEA